LAACDAENADTSSAQTETTIFETQNLRAAIDAYRDKPNGEREAKVAAALAEVNERIAQQTADLANLDPESRKIAETHIQDLKHCRDLHWARYVGISERLPVRVAEPVKRRPHGSSPPEAIAEQVSHKRGHKTANHHSDDAQN
jgi:hypothetical protein